MRGYAGTGTRSINTTNNTNTVVSLNQPNTALKRLAVYFLEIHSDATADNAYTIAVARLTAAGSGGVTFTPTILDPADGAASAIFRQNDTTNPTITAKSDLLRIGGHQRANVQWYAPPGMELIVPVTNNAGIVTICTVVTAGFQQVHTMHWTE